MFEKLTFVRLALLLLLIFFVGKLVVGFAGGSYQLGTRLFAMVPLTIHLCIIFGAVGKAYRGYRLTDVMLAGLLIALFAQILILVGTLGSYALGLSTHFNHPLALVNEEIEVSFGQAVGARITGLIANSVIGAVAALIGAALSSLLPRLNS